MFKNHKNGGNVSKIVILSAQLGAPQIINDLLQKIAASNPDLAEWIKGLDAVPIIKECVANSLARMAKSQGVELTNEVSDYVGLKKYEGELIGALKTDKLPRGLGFKVNEQGMVEFVADDFKADWKEEISRLRHLFSETFMAEVTCSLLEILGYEVEVKESSSGQNEVSFYLEGVKQ